MRILVATTVSTRLLSSSFSTGIKVSPPAFQVDYMEKSGYKPGVEHRDGVSSYLGLIMDPVAPYWYPDWSQFHGDISVFTSQIFIFGDKFVIMTNMTLGTLSECLKFPELGSREPRKRHSIWICSMFMIEKFTINVNANYADICIIDFNLNFIFRFPSTSRSGANAFTPRCSPSAAVLTETSTCPPPP